MKYPKVSILIPAYNHEKYIGETIQSVLDQTFGDFELIIINDGSSDQTETEILKFKDKRIRYYSQKNRGLTATLNRGIELAYGEFFNFLPSDDIFLSEKLEVQLKAFEESEKIGLVFSEPLIIDGEGGEVKDDPIVAWFSVPFETKEEIFPALFERDFLSAPTALIRMECFKKVGLFDESLKTAQDYDMWMRILKYYDLRLIKRPLLKYRWHGGNLTFQVTPETEMERAKIMLKAYKALAIQDIFPSLHQRRDTLAYAEAYEKLAVYMDKSGIPALLPVSQIYKDKVKSLKSHEKDFYTFEEEANLDRFDLGLIKRDQGKVHLLIETPSLDKGGMEEVIYHIATHLDQDLFFPVVVCIEKGGYTADRLKEKGIPVEILSEMKEKEYLEILYRYQIDLVNSHFSLFGAAIAYKEDIPVISVLHNIYSWYSGSLFNEFRITDRYISKYIAVSRQIASFFTYRFNIDERRVRIIPDGIDLKQFTTEGISEKLSRKDLGLDKKDFIFLHVGAITPAKMHNLLVAAMKEISKHHPKIKLISIGPKLDDSYYHFIQQMIEINHLGQHIQLIGFIKNLSPYYRLANAFILPSLIEGWGIVTLEAMYHGLPLILTKVGGAEEMIENQDIGILIENCCGELFQLNGADLDYYSHLDFPKNVPALIKAMINMYKNQKSWKRKAKEGRKKVVSRYTWNQVIPNYEKEFINLALERRREKESRWEDIIRDQSRELDRQSRIGDKSRELNRQSGELNRQSGELNRQSGELNRQSRELNRHNIELDRQSRIGDQSIKLGRQNSGTDEQLSRLEGEIVSLVKELQQRTDLINSQLDYILVRLSLTERTKRRAFNLLKTIHKIVPKKIRERYHSQYQKFFFKKIFPDQERFDCSIIPTDRHLHVSQKELDQFLDSVQNRNCQKLFVIYTTDPPLESRGQRSIWLAKEFARRGIPVLFFYWRWDPHEGIVKSADPQIFSIPIDEFSKIEQKLFSFSPDQFEKIFLIEFPDSFLFEKMNIANVNSFITVYDCIDNWEEFAKEGQAIWYDSVVERYIVRNSNLVIATNSYLAEKLKRMGASHIPIIPNGVDMTSFKQKQGDIKPVERRMLTIGYFGYLTDSWFDWDLVLRTASKRRDWIFHIIGYGEPSHLRLPPNVKFWGKVEHNDLPSYTRFWDVAIIPFKEGRLAEGVNPIKLYEYLFLGLPVVATNMPSLEGIPGVFSCQAEDFEDALIRAKETPFQKKDVKRFIQASTWGKRVDQILEEIERIDLSRDILRGIG